MNRGEASPVGQLPTRLLLLEPAQDRTQSFNVSGQILTRGGVKDP